MKWHCFVPRLEPPAFQKRRWLPVLLLFALALGRPGFAAPAPAPLVALDARDASAGSDLWANQGTLGPFTRIGEPVVKSVGGAPAVFLDGIKDAYRGPASVPAIEGRQPRTIEAWVYKPAVRYAEETLVAWGKRGGPAGAELALNYGNSPGFGAVTHWAEDLGWNGVPATGRWHQLVYTYDGVTAKIYDNTALKNSLSVRLRTAPGQTINLGVQNSGRGDLQFLNEYNRQPMSGPVYLAEVRIETGALGLPEIRQRFEAEAGRFHAIAAVSAYDLILGSGMRRLRAGPLVVGLSPTTQEALSLSPAGSAFDFLPSDRLGERAHDGFYQLGDLEFRTRTAGGDWRSYSTAAHHARVRPVTRGGTLAAADLAATLDRDCPLDVERQWIAEDGGLAVRFLLRNRTKAPIELGALGSPMVCDNILTGRSLEEAHEKCSFADPYVGGDAGYLQMTRLNGQVPALLVLPEPGTPFEAYRPLHDDPTPRSVTFEGFYEWMVYSRAYAEQEWKGAEEWNTPTDRILKPGETARYGFRFVLAPGVRGIEPTLAAHHRPVAVGIPGYVVPTDEPGRLFVRAPAAVTGVRVEPAGAMRVVVGRTEEQFTTEAQRAQRKTDELMVDGVMVEGAISATGRRSSVSRPRSPVAFSCTVYGLKPGRCRLTLSYADGSRQYIQYFVTPPAQELIRRFGEFHARKQWFADAKDPFHRTDSFMPYRRDRNEMVTQYDPTWMVGLSDEMGAGPNLAMAMKNLGQPDPGQVSLLEQYVDHALWGHLQYPDYGVRASLFYYDPVEFPDYYTVRGGWDRARTETTWRSFNYPHQAAIYWSLYRLARDHPGLVTARPWQWYLRQAYQTAMAMGTHAGPPPGGLQQFGQMVGDVYLEILADLHREGWTKEAGDLEAYERVRADHFRSLRYPFGSEMPWDSTGQEEVYLLCRYFGFNDKSRVTIDAVLGYDPTVPNWGYNGAARRYFDEGVNGTRWPDIMRLLHHYGGAMNAMPLLTDYRDHPDDFYLLRVAYGGTMGALTDIDPDGAASQCFDPDPAIMKFDPFVGDYGIEFYGFAHNSGSYVAHHPVYGWVGFGCNVTASGHQVRIVPKDAFRNRLYTAPLGLFVTLDAGTFESAVLDTALRTVTLTLSPGSRFTPEALLRVERGKATGPSTGFVPASGLPVARGAYVVRLGTRAVRVVLRPTRG